MVKNIRVNDTLRGTNRRLTEKGMFTIDKCSFATTMKVSLRVVDVSTSMTADLNFHIETWTSSQCLKMKEDVDPASREH